MGEIAEIIKTVHDIVQANQDVPVAVDARGLGMAYAVPRGLEATAVETYSPWRAAELRQVFYRESSVFGAVLAEVQLIVSWRYSEARQYIVDVFLDKNVISLDPTTSVSLSVRFSQPSLYDVELEAYEIPFVVTISFRPIGNDSTSRFIGTVRADGTGNFVEE